MKSLVTKLALVTLLCAGASLQAWPWWPKVDPSKHQRHDLEKTGHSPDATSYSPSKLPEILNNPGKLAFIALAAANIRLHNKAHNPQHLRFMQTLNPITMLRHPIRCLDDGFIGHAGSHNAPAYGALGTAWSWVPKVDNAIVALDAYKRKIEAWLGWFDRNLKQINETHTRVTEYARNACDFANNAQKRYDAVLAALNEYVQRESETKK